MVGELLEFKEQLDNIVTGCFQRNDHFLYSMREAFEFFINQRQNKPAKLIAGWLILSLVDEELESLPHGVEEAIVPLEAASHDVV
ncbi:unnamed protein product [Pieris macdunnoughi]|uniref:Cullin N-terminal domain-containing protein n=1 Tax=Pieris macdunnoughi TaxID=345717 RepID=A0A821TIH5_9NEOP|nr:unnamed protein product [Pieris macdunnoughi]